MSVTLCICVWACALEKIKWLLPNTSSVFRYKIQIMQRYNMEQFVVLMYDRSSDRMKVNEARMELFTKKQRAYELFPPTQGALKRHVKCAAFQAGHIRVQFLVCEPDIQCPSKWGWLKENKQWKTFWTALETIAKSCQELTKYECKTKCGERCKCFKCGIACTIRCSCPCDG